MDAPEVPDCLAAHCPPSASVDCEYPKCAPDVSSIEDIPAIADAYAAAAEPTPAGRYALVEQMGYRRVTGTVRETEFCGRPMLEVTDLRDGTVRLVGAESLYQVTWLSEAQAKRNVEPPKAIGYITWDERDDTDRRANGESDDDPGDEP